MHAESLRKERVFRRTQLRRHPRGLHRERTLRLSPRSRAAGPAPPEKRGTFERADGGTLFLDEVGDMSLKTQAKVLRALDEQRFLPVGASQPIHVDVRVIAATNKDLEEEIATRQLPRRPLLPPQRHPVLRPAAARPQGRHPAARQGISARVRPAIRPPARRNDRRRARRAPAIPLARQRPRTAQYDRARPDPEPARPAHRAQTTAHAGLSRPGKPTIRPLNRSEEFATL